MLCKQTVTIAQMIKGHSLVMLHPNCHRQLHHSSETGSQYWGLIKA
ncbi:hypothetical protein SGB_00957 [Shigella boydii ATCC 9905]|nr:hypothetical protein SGB_00957 [Shigella boydii ATCC 9905]